MHSHFSEASNSASKTWTGWAELGRDNTVADFLSWCHLAEDHEEQHTAHLGKERPAREETAVGEESFLCQHPNHQYTC
ncbi:hypothetical protein Y1Q_0022499 [Alligator mississippiensis]|uniref:Uncharacterized protein n=1 Tax=Alligator mississippiensis TaxID=8496 RepID=A0A151N0E9_ALLMI|nr:hypothetical protein Y1Q_0022499 [Alligator mississippiensis]